MVRIAFTEDGGLAVFPGLQKSVTLDTAALPPDEAGQLEDLVAAAQVFQRPAEPAMPRGAADYRSYTITVEHGERQHTIRVSEPVTDRTLQALIAALQARAASAG